MANYDSASKLWSGKDHPSPLFHENVTVGRAVLHLLHMNPDKICQISADDGSMRTNGEIYRETLNIALNLQERGCSRGDVVGFVSKNSHDLTPAFLAAQFLGAPTNALDVQFLEDEIAHMFTTTEPRFVFCDDDVAEKVHRSLHHIGSTATMIILGKKVHNFIHIDELLEKGDQLEIINLQLHPPEVDRKSCSAIICSSGTTGRSKGVALSHEAIQMMFCKPTMSQFINSNNSMFCFSSLYWLSGYISMFQSFFMGFRRIITTKPFTPELLIQIVKDYNVTHLLTPPTHAAQLVNCSLLERDSLAGLKSYLCGGSLVTKELSDKIRPYVYNGIFTIAYGMTESGGISMESQPLHEVSVGSLVAGCNAKIIDEDGRALGFGESGEICVKTKTQFLGYYGNPKATKEILRDGWIHTGDLGYFDKDSSLSVSGRKKDMLKYNGFQIIPSEIEEILETHPDVCQAVVVGIPDPEFSDLPAACIVRKVGSSVTEEELTVLVEKRVPDYRKLRGGVYFIDNLPMTPSGKIRKFKVQQLAVSLFKDRQS